MSRTGFLVTTTLEFTARQPTAGTAVASSAPVPQDIELRNHASKRLDDILTERSLPLGTLEFVEMFGGDTRTLQPGLKELEELYREA